MGYDIRKNEEGATVVMPLELPMYNSDTSELGRQATVSLASALRHAAVIDFMDDNLHVEGDEVLLEEYANEYSQATAQLVSTFMSLAGIADNLGIDIMREIWDMPWSV